MLNNPNDNMHDLEQQLDSAGQSFRDRCTEHPPEAPEGFIDAVADVRVSTGTSPRIRTLKLTAAIIAVAASLTLVVTLWPKPIQHDDSNPDGGRMISTARGLNPMSAGALRFRNLNRPLDDPDLPSASIVNWVVRTNPLGPE